MKTKRITLSFMSLLLLLVSLAGLAQAQGPVGEPGQESSAAREALQDPAPTVSSSVNSLSSDEASGGAGVTALLSDAIPFQGRLTDASGNPIKGTRSMTLALYDVATGGVAQCTATKGNVEVVDGLFTFYLTGCNISVLDGKQLYLGVTVGTDPEMTPRQPVYAVPYARSLRPGAMINQTSAALHGLSVQSTGAGEAGTALWVQNANTTSGIGVWATVVGNEAAVVASNNGAGPGIVVRNNGTGAGALFKGFGADDEPTKDEFRINNDGAVETKADSYLWIPGNALVKDLSSDTTRWDIQANGGVRIYRGSATGNKTVFFPVTIPSVLYGRAVKIEEVVIFYKTSNSVNAYINKTEMYRFTNVSTQTTIFSDDTDRNSAVDANYTAPLSANIALSATMPGAGLLLNLSFVNDTDYVQIGGIRIRLGHHSQY